MSETSEPLLVERPRGIAAFVERGWVAPFFLVATTASIFLCGLFHALSYFMTLDNAGPGTVNEVLMFEPRVLQQAAIYTFAVLAILGSHEMGHWLVARAHKVRTSLPIFIPMPLFIGTFGAIIAMNELPPTRRALIRIGAAGPLAGGIVALIAMAFAIAQSPTVPFARFEGPELTGGYTVFGESIATKVLTGLFQLTVPEGHTVLASPLFMAAWTGFLLTSINLLPIGQLDGGHVLYGLIGERANRFARPLTIVVMLLAIPATLWRPTVLWPPLFWSWQYVVWGAIVRRFAAWHPPVPEPEARLPLDAKLLAVACALLLVLTFMISPIKQVP